MNEVNGTSLRTLITRSVRSGLRHVGRLLTRMVGTIAGASLFVFLLLEVSLPGGFRAVLLPPGDTRSPRARRLIDEYHLDDHVLIRYVRWLGDAAQGDFGNSSLSGDPVVDLIAPRIPISLQIMLVGVALTVLIGIPLGILAVALDGTFFGRRLNVVLGLAQSIPVFVTPLFLIAYFAVNQRWLPASGWTRISESVGGNVRTLILPITALVLAEVGVVARIVRADVMRVLQSDFIAAARGKGLSNGYILFRHALRPASLGLLNVIGLNIGALLSGAVVIELIFGIGALGQSLLEATLNRDLPLLLAITAYTVVVYVILNTIVDALLMVLDPRIRRTQ